MMSGARRWLWLSVIVVVSDQLSKGLVTFWLELGDRVPVLPGVDLVMVHNTGAAFSMLAEMGGWQRWFLLAAAAAICLFLLQWLRRLTPGENMEAAGIALIIGGAVGNMIDRAWLGYVVDFIDVYYGRYHWPAFNVADGAITSGALTMIISIWKVSDGNTAG